MKPAFESVNLGIDHSFRVKRFEEQNFQAPYHYHPELELTYIVNGSGKRYVGSHMTDFSSGDLVLLGSNVPHCWKTNNSSSDKPATSIVIQFRKDFMGDDFFAKPEMHVVAKLLTLSLSGIHFTSGVEIISMKMEQMLYEANPFRRFQQLMDILYELGELNYSVLDRSNFTTSVSVSDKERINRVLGYIIENFRNKITLYEAASVANLTGPAFCKYFKRLTRKTFMEVVTDYRVDYAMQQLVHSNDSILDIGFDSGFNDVSHFHRVFKNRSKLSPLNYRRKFRSNIN